MRRSRTIARNCVELQDFKFGASLNYTYRILTLTSDAGQNPPVGDLTSVMELPREPLFIGRLVGESDESSFNLTVDSVNRNLI
jgi:hypothetical protein